MNTVKYSTPWDEFLALSNNEEADIRWVNQKWVDMKNVIQVKNKHNGHVSYIKILTMLPQFEGRYGQYKMTHVNHPHQNTPEQVDYFKRMKPDWLSVV